MKFLSIFTLMFAFQLFAVEPSKDLAKTDSVETEEVSEGITENTDSPAGTAMADAEEAVEGIAENTDPPAGTAMEGAEEAVESEALVKFLVEEVFPAFGGFQDILFSKPSFEIHWTPESMQIKNCSFRIQLKQLRAVRYNLADIQLYGFRSDAEIGDPRWLVVDISCEEAPQNKTRFKVKFFVTDEELNPSYYSLKIKTMDKEQLDIKLGSVEMDLDIETVEDVLLSDPYGRVEVLPKDSPFLEFFEEEKAYAEITEDEPPDSSLEENRNMYDIPLSLWGQIQKGDLQAIEGGSLPGDLIPLKKWRINKVIFLEGSVEILLPVYQEGVREDTRVMVPVTGRIFSSAEGDFLPVVDISMD